MWLPASGVSVNCVVALKLTVWSVFGLIVPAGVPTLGDTLCGTAVTVKVTLTMAVGVLVALLLMHSLPV